MPQNISKGRTAVIHEIKKKNRLSNSIVTFVIFALLAVILRYLYEPVISFLDFLPAISITIIIAFVFLLSVLGLYISRKIAKQSIRIIEDYSGKIERLLEITNDLREEMYGDILLDKIMDYAMSITSSEAGSILLLNEENRLTFKIVKGEKASKLVGTSIEKGRGISGWVTEKGVPVRISDASKDERFNPEIDAITGLKTKSVLCMPLKTQSGIIGVLELLNKEGGHTFRERDEEIIRFLADQAAISIIKTQFYEDQKNYQIHFTEMMLGAIDFHLTEKEGHSRRVARYSNIIARTLNMPEEEMKKLYFTCLLHDVGFLKIKAEDAYKKEEFMKHPVIGYEMIKPITYYADIAPFILHHHERYDGTGYPSNLQGEEIPRTSRIVAVAEAFDAMVSSTSYKVPISFETAIEELQKNAGTQFDPELVKIFVDNISPDHVQ